MFHTPSHPNIYELFNCKIYVYSRKHVNDEYTVQTTIFCCSFSVQVNAEDLRSVSHDQAAKCLKNAGTTVELLVEYRPNEYQQFQIFVQDVKENELVPTGSIVPTPKKEFYIRCVCVCVCVRACVYLFTLSWPSETSS